MKKKLEADLMSIAHRVLKLKNKEDVRELHHETQKLYEKLSVLLFIEENFDPLKPTISLHEIEDKLEKKIDIDKKIAIEELKEEDFIETKNEIVIPIIGIKEEETIINSVQEKELETPIIEFPKPDKKQVSIDELLNTIQSEPVFEKVKKEKSLTEEISKIIEDKIETNKENETTDFKKFIDIPQPLDYVFEKVSGTNLNDKLKKGINIGLNDRLAFEKNLFGGSSEDFNRVLSQLSTFDTLEDATNFIIEMVKPDYNNWKGQDDIASRFMEIVESKFI